MSTKTSNEGNPSRIVPVFHICWLHSTYRIIARGRKWLQGELLDGRRRNKPLIDKIAINDVSSIWEVGGTYTCHNRHEDLISPYGHRVTIFPVNEEEYALSVLNCLSVLR